MSFTVIGLGELLWDLLPAGAQLGGAPTNFVCHAQSLGAQASIVSRVGSDDLGREALNRFDVMNISRAFVQVDDALPTGTVTVRIGRHGVPKFTICENVAWDRMTAGAEALEAVRHADAVCFGSLAQRARTSRLAIQRLVAATPAGALRLFDINLRQNWYSLEVIESSLRLANVLKLNREELSVLTKMFSLRGDVRRRMQRLIDTFELKVMVLTCGASGSLICHQGRWSKRPQESTPVVDTVGAGDAFAATLTMGQ